MGVITELIRTEADGTLSFGNYELEQKTKLSDYLYQGDMYKIKTFYEITKLEKNGLFVYESVPGTAVNGFSEAVDGVEFMVEGREDAQITLGLEESREYEVFVDDESAGVLKTNMGGKLSLSVELSEGMASVIRVSKV